MWNVVNSETGRLRPIRDYTDLITQSDGSKFHNKTDAVDAVNAHFVNAAATCGAPAADVAAATCALAAVRPPSDRSLRFKLFTAHEVFRIISTGVARKNSKDVYDVSVSLLHNVASPIAQVLSCLYNQCCRQGRYPLTLKQVKVSPLYKGKGKQGDINNYRPVSIIPCIAKIFEHGLSKRLTNYLTDCKLLSDRQYAYRAGRSTTCLAREVVRRVLEARENSEQVAVIFCDLSKAFDVADHGVLVAKMRHYGINGPALQLLAAFMQGRSQVVVGEGGRVKSKPLQTFIGVAQGSSLSNIMFSLLLNDLPENVRNGHVLMYADDVAAVVTASSTEQLERRLNAVTCDLNRWFMINGLILNINKTQYMSFDLSGRAQKPLRVSLGDTELKRVTHTTFLGFQLDSSLTWESHIDKLCEKVGRACFALWRVAAILPSDMVRSCYFASVHSLIQYGIEIWGRAADWERVFRMQKRAVRAVMRVPQDTPARSLFRSMRILTVPSMVILQAALYARVHLEEYPKFGNGHHYNTRNAHLLRAVPRRLTKTSRLVHVMAPAVYNRLPEEIKCANSINSFKWKTKKWLTEQTFYTFDEFVK